MSGKRLIPFSFALLTVLMFLTACGNGEEGEGGAAVERKVSVTLATATRQAVQVELRSVGRLVSMNTPLLAAEISARVVAVLVEEGQPVRQGQVLILLDTTAFELASREAEAEIERLKASIANEERRVARYRDLKTKNMMSQERMDDAEAKLAVDRASMLAAKARLAIAEDRLSKAELISPVTGVVEERHVSVGDYVQVGGAMVTVTDTFDLRAELPFPDRGAGRCVHQPDQAAGREHEPVPGRDRGSGESGKLAAGSHRDGDCNCRSPPGRRQRAPRFRGATACGRSRVRAGQSRQPDRPPADY
jgi:multidrug efflux pump subunit AcrA (membrane-fusion protein)